MCGDCGAMHQRGGLSFAQGSNAVDIKPQERTTLLHGFRRGQWVKWGRCDGELHECDEGYIVYFRGPFEPLGRGKGLVVWSERPSGLLQVSASICRSHVRNELGPLGAVSFRFPFDNGTVTKLVLRF